jgi:hypothetical protein
VQYANLELASFASSWIPTTGSTVQRGADLAEIGGTHFGSGWYNDNQGTYFAVASIIGGNVSASGAGFPNPLYKTTTNSLNLFARNFMFQRNVSPNRFQATHRDSSSIAPAFDSAYDDPIVAMKRYRIASGYTRGGTIAMSVDGRDFKFAGNSITPDTPTRLLIGRGNVGAVAGAPTADDMFLSGHIRRLVYFNQRFSDTQLKEISALPAWAP